MTFTDQELKKIIEKETIKSRHPYSGFSYYDCCGAIDGFIKDIVGQLQADESLDVVPIYDNYGQGFASYVDVFITMKSVEATKRTKDTLWTYGITLYISRLAPIAVYGKNEMMLRDNGASGYGYLTESKLYTLPSGKWKDVLSRVVAILEKNNIEVLEKEYLMTQLGFDACIPTVFKKSDYVVYDALFYWAD